ncbi:MAG: AarF/UbiB family protein [Myxococcota bacterium]|nr:AarF/UbiB family protein [Myxococcota bacterium]
MSNDEVESERDALAERLEMLRRWQHAAQAMPRVAMGLFRHGLMPAGLSTADTVRREGFSELHWKVLGDGLVRFLRNAGPVFTKFGQILATRSDLLPPTVCSRLESLYAEQPPMGHRELERALDRAYGKERPFRDFVREPLAVGSVGQVHRAALEDGTRVVVKIIRPGAEARIASDLQLARVLAGVVADATTPARRVLLDRLLDDLGEGYAREVDLHHEARALRDFAQRFASNPNVRVPACFEGLSSEHVLVMEELVGEPLSAFRARARSDPEAARRAARLALTEILAQVFEDGRFHADPHAGNLLVLEDGRLGLIDLGLTGELSREERRLVARAVRAFLSRDPDAVMEALLGLTTVPADFDRAAFRAEVRALVRSRGRHVADRLKGGEGGATDDDDANALDVFVSELFALAHEHGVNLPTSATLLIKSLVTIEGVARALHPEIDLAKVAAPVMVRALAPRWARWVFRGRVRRRRAGR